MLFFQTNDLLSKQLTLILKTERSQSGGNVNYEQGYSSIAVWASSDLESEQLLEYKTIFLCTQIIWQATGVLLFYSTYPPALLIENYL